MCLSLPLKNPSPDFKELEKVLKGKKEAKKVHFVEFSVDNEVIELVMTQLMGKKLLCSRAEEIKQEAIEKFTEEGHKVALLIKEEEKIFMKGYIEFYYRMGYDYVPDIRPTRYLRGMIGSKVRIGKDTATIPRKGGNREWVEEGTGIITSWQDFEKFPWERISLDLENYYEFFSQNLPKGMKIMITGSLFETVLERFLGYEGLLLLHDQADLVRAVSDRWGEIVYNFYISAIPLEIVGGIFHADDLGYRTGTMVSPDVLREMFFPWFKKYASLAHQYDKMYWYHCCGNVSEIMEDLIEDIGIDAFHSFQDVITPVIEFKKRYGNRIGVLGGVDVDRLCRLDKKSLRNYTRNILAECMLGGRYALGSGNSIANYISVDNYLAMLEEGLRLWR